MYVITEQVPLNWRPNFRGVNAKNWETKEGTDGTIFGT